MGNFTLDIKGNTTEAVKTYTVSYEPQSNDMYAVDLYDEKGKLLFQSGCYGAVICFDKIRNFIYTFGKIQNIHIDEKNKAFRDQLLSKLHTLSLFIDDVKFEIRYYDDRTDVSSFGTNFNGLIKILLIDDARRSKESREQIMNDNRLALVNNVQMIVNNNSELYDRFDITYEFDDNYLNTSTELIKTFKIKLKS